MAKIIIGIHGLSNKPRPELTEKWWLQSIEEGLKRFYPSGYPAFDFKLVYWADVLYDLPYDETITDTDNPLFLKEPYTPGNENYSTENQPVKQIIRDKIVEKLNRIFLNDDYSLNFSKLNDFVISHTFKDLEAYFQNSTNRDQILVRDELRMRLARILIKYQKDDIMLIGHSMGSIISYDVLSLFSTQVKVKTLVTLGSPLGLPVVISRIARELGLTDLEKQNLRTPASVKKSWLNFADIADNIAFNNKLEDDFSRNPDGVGVTDIMVKNDYCFAGTKNPHKVYGYLRTHEFSAKLFEFLNEKEIPFYKLIWNSIKSTLK